MQKHMKPDYKQGRQGDVLIERVPALPEGVKPRTEKEWVAFGESQDHGHAMIGNLNLFIAPDDSDVLYAEVLKPSTLEHLKISSKMWTKEHHTIFIDKPGIYRITGQYEYDPYEKAIERVVD